MSEMGEMFKEVRADSRHRAFTVKLVRLLDDGEPNYDEYNGNRPCDLAWRRVQRAARRWLAVMEGKR